MNNLSRRLIIAGSLTLFGCNPVYSQTENKEHFSHFGIGLNYGGAQFDWRPSPRWMFEIRAQKGTDKTESIETRSSIAGLRTYRFFRGEKTLSPLLGLEAAHVEAKQTGSSYQASGVSAGLFAGLSLKMASHFLLEFDMGPYFIKMREQNTNVGQSEVEFVGDTSLIFLF